jgi:transposase
MAIHCGVDFHSRQQLVMWCDTRDGEIHERRLAHASLDEVRGFYSQFDGEVIVGIEASGYSEWFATMLHDLGHQVWVGDATEIRRRARSRQKTDRRDAQLILDLLLKGEFPRINKPSRESLEVLRRLRYRHRLVQLRTAMRNSLQALALGSGVVLKAKLRTQKGRQRLGQLPLSPALSQQRADWLELIEQIEERIARVEREAELADGDERIRRLRTHPGIGLLTALALVHTLCPVSRFANSRKVTAYVGLEPREDSSGERRRMGHISKAGSRVLRFLLVEADNTPSAATSHCAGSIIASCIVATGRGPRWPWRATSWCMPTSCYVTRSITPSSDFVVRIGGLLLALFIGLKCLSTWLSDRRRSSAPQAWLLRPRITPHGP